MKFIFTGSTSDSFKAFSRILVQKNLPYEPLLNKEGGLWRFFDEIASEQFIEPFVIIHLAHTNKKSNENSLSDNEIGTKLLLDQLNNYPLINFFYISSVAANGLSIYGSIKKKTEDLLQNFSRIHIIRCGILQHNNMVFGKWRRYFNFIRKFRFMIIPKHSRVLYEVTSIESVIVVILQHLTCTKNCKYIVQNKIRTDLITILNLNLHKKFWLIRVRDRFLLNIILFLGKYYKFKVPAESLKNIYFPQLTVKSDKDYEEFKVAN
jgi:hypothetical protein